jgi:hypothetical protein
MRSHATASPAVRDREQYVLRQELAHNAAPARSQGKPHADFARIGGSAGEQQIGQVRACGEQNQSHYHHEQSHETKHWTVEIGRNTRFAFGDDGNLPTCVADITP